MDIVSLPVDSGYMFFNLPEVIRIEACSKHTKLFLDGKEKPVIIKRGIGELQKMDEFSYGFYRCHRSHFVNMRFVCQYNAISRLLVMPDTKVPVARKKVKMFIKKFCKNRGDSRKDRNPEKHIAEVPALKIACK